MRRLACLALIAAGLTACERQADPEQTPPADQPDTSAAPGPEEPAAPAPIVVAGTAEAPFPVLSQLWVTEGFLQPEGVTLSADGSFYYVSNVNGEGSVADSNGFISKMGLDGDIIELEWATGLDAPKGMALYDGDIVVSDITSVTRIDAGTGEIVESIPVDGAAFLNDVAFVPNEGVLISDSGTGRIHQYRGGTVTLWAEDAAFDGINGLLAHDGQILVVAMTAGELLSVDPATKAITVIAGGMENADMMTPLDEGGYLVSSWPGLIHYVDADGQSRIIQDTTEMPVNMNDFTRNGNVLVVPNWRPSTVRAYEISWTD